MNLNLKYGLILVSFILYTLGVIWVTNRVVDYKYTKEKLDIVTQVLDTKIDNDKIAADVSKLVEESINTYMSKSKTITKEIQHEVFTNHVYTDCKSTDGIVQQYQRKLDSQ